MTRVEVPVTVVIPTIPTRRKMLTRAILSVRAQTVGVADVVVELDESRSGAAATRQRALERVATPYVAFLDDDDEFLPRHVERLFDHLVRADADYVYSWYEIVGGRDPMPQFFGRPWDDGQPHQTTITVLCDTGLALGVGGFGGGPMPDPNGGGGMVGGEDYRFTLACLAAGARISHLPERTWRWHHHGRNTSGLPRNW